MTWSASSRERDPNGFQLMLQLRTALILYGSTRLRALLLRMEAGRRDRVSATRRLAFRTGTISSKTMKDAACPSQLARHNVESHRDRRCKNDRQGFARFSHH